jgi:adenylyltransferase/sulfurtransferase
VAAGLDLSERERYGRQILSFGEEGQERLKNAHIAIAGAGGLGSPVAIYLAVAGVGRLTLIDQDTVERTNLNRQVLHGETDIGGRRSILASRPFGHSTRRSGGGSRHDWTRTRPR